MMIGPETGAHGAWRRVLAASLLGAVAMSPAHSQELPITVPQGTAASRNLQQCQLSARDILRAGNDKAQKVIRQLQSEVDDFHAAQNQLLQGNKTFGGLGPDADSKVALRIAESLETLEASADAITDFYGELELSAGSTVKALTEGAVFQLLKEGKTLWDIYHSTSAKEAAYQVALEVGNWRPGVKTIAGLAKNIHEAIENGKAWEELGEELQSRLDTENRMIAESERKLQQLDAQRQQALEAGISEYCDAYAKPQLVALTVNATDTTPILVDVVAQARDPSGSAMRLVSLDSAGESAQGHATVDYSQSARGQIRYTPPQQGEGRDRFRFKITDAAGRSAEEWLTVNLTVEPNKKQNQKGVDLDAIYNLCRTRGPAQFSACVDAQLRLNGESQGVEQGRDSAYCANLRSEIASLKQNVSRYSQQAAAGDHSGDSGLNAANTQLQIDLANQTSTDCAR